jgi:hypothetical protein
VDVLYENVRRNKTDGPFGESYNGSVITNSRGNVGIPQRDFTPNPVDQAEFADFLKFHATYCKAASPFLQGISGGAGVDVCYGMEVAQNSIVEMSIAVKLVQFLLQKEHLTIHLISFKENG